MASQEYRNKNLRRPRKSDADRARRARVHRKRLVALGLPEERVNKMNIAELRRAVQQPARVHARD
jgi:hypothetical protein